MTIEELINERFDELKKLTLLGAKDVLNMDETALLIGVSKQYLYRMVQQKKIPYYKSPGGKQTYFKKVEVNEWLLSVRMATAEEFDQQAADYCLTHPTGR